MFIDTRGWTNSERTDSAQYYPCLYFSARGGRPKFRHALKEVFDCVWELESEEFKNIYRSEVGLFMLYPRGGPRGSQVNIKRGLVVSQFAAASALELIQQKLLHDLNICTTFRAELENEKWFAVCPFTLKRQVMCQNQSEITVYVPVGLIFKKTTVCTLVILSSSLDFQLSVW